MVFGSVNKECEEFSGFVVSYLQFSYAPPRSHDPITGKTLKLILSTLNASAISQIELSVVLNISIIYPQIARYLYFVAASRLYYNVSVVYNEHRYSNKN